MLWAKLIAGLGILAGLVLLLRGVIGRRVGTTPRCSSCGYDLRATPDRCPECGQATHGREFRVGSRARSLRKSLLGLLILLLGVLSTGALQILGTTNNRIIRHLPTPVVVYLADHRDNDVALAEILRRVHTQPISPGEAECISRAAIKTLERDCMFQVLQP